MPVTLYALAIDCANAARLAEFWAAVLGQPVDEDPTADFASIGFAAAPKVGPAWTFARVPEGKTAKNRVHPDLVVADLDAEVSRIVGLGASKKAEYDEVGYRWITLTDPEDNEFDVMAADA
jgi:predicted enzyme related to lactoylglutathione lyase